MDLLQGVVRAYDWGDRRAIADLLGYTPPGHPEAEYWLGAHPSAPSRLVDDGSSLDARLARDVAGMVGPLVSERFAGFPYLLKVLAAERPLSIQAHPNLPQAKAGFAREDAAGIDRQAPNRSYRDDNHKPELICAITAFEAKCGFRPLVETRRLVDGLAAGPFAGLQQRLDRAGGDAEVLADTVGWLLALPAAERSALADAAVIASASAGNDLRANFGPELDWTERIARWFPGDIGIVVALLLNHVTLAPGQAIFLQAGNLHSYLKGVGVELMANSDNVLRGGLTTKHIDVAELLRVVDYEPGAPPVQSPSSPVHVFETPVPEFSLTRLDSSAARLGDPTFEPIGPEIVLVTAGEVVLETRDRTLVLAAGSACFVSYDDGRYRVIDRTPGSTVAWRAAVGAGLHR